VSQPQLRMLFRLLTEVLSAVEFDISTKHSVHIISSGERSILALRTDT